MRLSSLLLLTVLSLLVSPLVAQFNYYSTAPKLWHTFDVPPPQTSWGANATSFSWSYGVAPHVGTALFNGISDWIDLYLLPDDYGNVLPHTLPRSISFEWWVKWNQLNSWSRILDLGNGPRADNVLVSNVGESNDLRAAMYRGNITVNQWSIATRAIHPNLWQHIVVSVRAKRRGDYNQPDSGEISIYIDGAVASHTDSAWLLNNVQRQNAWIGRSEWQAVGETNDGFFYGWLDDFFYYDYPLSAEAALVHYVLPRPPIYELTFASDPREIQQQPYTYTYSWSTVDDRDSSNITQYHNGHLVLVGDSYVDLEVLVGGSSVGAYPPPVIGGPSGANGTLPQGWSIEILVKALAHETHAKLFDFGNGEGMDNIALGFAGDTAVMHFEIFNSASANQSDFAILDNTQLGQWYHIIIVMEPHLFPGSRVGSVRTYINGVAGPSRDWFNSPLPVARAHGYIGKSNWVADQYFDCFLDAFRIYDYALTLQEVRDLYTVTHEELPRGAGNATLVYSFHTGPVASYTFNSRPQQSQFVDGTSFSWNNTSPFPHYGLAEFNGVNQYINLASYPSNAAGSVFPVIGQSMSFECWVMWQRFGQYSRIIDLGSISGYQSNNIILANVGQTPTLMLEVYSGEYSSGVYVNDVLELNRWHHIIASVEQRSLNDTFTAQAAILHLYLDGQEIGNNFGYLPQRVSRPNAFLARSNWRQDAYFYGKMDAFYYYDYALVAEQASAHYLVPKPPVFELAFNKDPREWLGGDKSEFTYSWQAFDPADFITSNTTQHNGHLVLRGDQYVNLTTTTGYSSVGTALPGVLFGTPSNVGDYRWYGWSIEILVKIDTQETGAKIFEFGAAPFQDNIGIGYWDNRSRLNLYIYGGPDGTYGEHIPVIDYVELHRWYHIVIVLRHGNEWKADVAVYLDGELGQPLSNDFLPFPRAVNRTRCYLGKSNWDDQYFDMNLDTFRIYDIALTADYVRRLYALTTADAPQLVKPLYTSGPLVQYTFDAAPDPQFFQDGTSFEWSAGSTNHPGVALFNGETQWINLMTLPDETGIPFPAVIGNNSMSFEIWARFDGYRLWSRLLDLGNGVQGDEILLAEHDTSQLIDFHTWRRINSTDWAVSALSTSGPVINLGQWRHVVVTLDDLTKYPTNAGIVDPQGMQAAWVSLYIDGSLWAEGYGQMPRETERTLAYVGKSMWSEDALFLGAIDSLYYYNYALSAEQVNVHRNLPRPAIFDLSFSSDPRWLLGGDYGSYTYSWQDFDPSDAYANSTRFHSGHLVLDGLSREGSYVNLSTTTGHSTVGVLLPRVGGRSDPISGTAAGWTFEMIVKLSTVGKWAKLLDWGTEANVDQALDNIQFGYGGDTDALEFRVWNSYKGVGASAQFNVIEHVQLNRWYHIVVVVRPRSVSDFTADYLSYIDGVQTNSLINDGYLPQSLKRQSALLGRTNWIYSDDAPFACKLDAIRVYDYALTGNNIRTLYQLAHDPNAMPDSHVGSTAGYRPPVPVVSSSSSAASRPSSSSAVSSSVISSSTTSSSSPSSAAPPASWTSPRFSSSIPAKRCPSWASGWEPNCKCRDGGVYPNCWCPEPSMDYWPNCEDTEYGVSSSTGSTSSSSGGPSSALIAGIVIALLLIAAVGGYVYYRFFRTPAELKPGQYGGAPSGSTDTRPVETSKTSLLSADHHLGSGSNGTDGSSGVYQNSDAENAKVNGAGVEML